MARKHLVVAALGALAVVAAGCGSSSSSSSSGTTGSQSSSSSGGGYGAPAPAPKKKTTAPTVTSGQVLKFSADASGALQFNTSKLSAKAGTVTVRMTNPSGVAHSIAIKGNGVNQFAPQAQVTGGQTATVTAKLKPGTYEFFCPIPGHEAAGMKGTLTVA